MVDLVKLYQSIPKFDLFTIKMHLNRFSVVFGASAESGRLALMLKKAVLEELVKDSEKELVYGPALVEILNALALANSESEIGYRCSLVGCRFVSDRHKSYIVHLRKDHPNIKQVTCNFRKECKRTFPSTDLLVQHLKNSHTTQKEVASTVQPAIVAAHVNIACKCNRLSCGASQFENTNQLITHWNTYHSNEERDCIFRDCDTTFGKSSMSRNHFRLKHKNTGKLVLKDRHILSSSAPGPGPTLTDEGCDRDGMDQDQSSYNVVEEEAEIEYNEDDLNVIDNFEEEDLNEEYYLDYWADFLNRMGHYSYIPQTTVTDIATEYLQNAKKSMENRKKILRKSLNRTEMNPGEIERIVDDVENDAFLRAQMKLDSEYKRTKYVRENMKYIAPVEVLLNKEDVKRGEKKEVFHYVSVVETFRNILEDPSFIKMKSMEIIENQEDKFQDLKDGSNFVENKFFKSNPGAYAAILYSDALELKNPLGAARGSYKVVQTFLTFADITKSQRSQVDRLQLVMVFREKLLAKHSLKTIYKPLIDDLKKLEAGIVIKFPTERTVKCGVLCYSSDNLEASVVGGFSACFSSKDVCRVCHIQYSDLESNIHDFKDEPHNYWSEEEYNKIISSMASDSEEDTTSAIEEVEAGNLFTEFDEEDEDKSDDERDDERDEDVDSSDENSDEEGEDNSFLNKRGIKSECPFNCLESFHSTKSFPPDLLHDVFEGVVPLDLLGIIRILSSKGWFNLDQYNSALVGLGYKSNEMNDKPCPIPVSNKVKKLKGKAVRDGFLKYFKVDNCKSITI